MTRGRQILLAACALTGLQGGAIMLYRFVESPRRPSSRLPPSFRALPAGTVVPPLPARRLDGSLLDLNSLRGRVVIVHFWATWCPPCRTELPGLLALGEQLERRDQAVLLAVATDEEWGPVRDFLGGSVHESVLLGPGTAAAFDVDQLPATFVVAADGTLRTRIDGAQDWRLPAAQRLLQVPATD
jgi:thiol-disulfide isomerase/thioredoxin